MRRLVFVLCLLTALGGTARAVLPDEQLRDSRLEARARAVGAQLRCLVCQNQTIDDSDADLARDLRIILRERLLAGDTDRQAIQFIVARYGSYVLLRPPLERQTVLLWFGPLIVFVVGGTWIALMARGRSDRGAVPLTGAEQAELTRRLNLDGPA